MVISLTKQETMHTGMYKNNSKFVPIECTNIVTTI